MKKESIRPKSSNQLRWVILLLAVAVILPTVCLLWFMTQAVKNERLAVRQRLIDVYTEKAGKTFIQEVEAYWKESAAALGRYVESRAESIRLLPENYMAGQSRFDAFIIYDRNGEIVYPVPAGDGGESDGLSDILQPGWEAEFRENNDEQAITEYGKTADTSSVPAVVYHCKMGIARCLARQDKFAQAIAICLELAYPDKTLIGRYAPDQIARARLMLADLYSQAGHGDLLKELRRQLLNAPLADDPEYTPLEGMPTGTRVFVATELVRLAGESGLANELAGEIQGVQKRIHSELISLDALEWLGDKDKRVPQSRPEMAFRRMREPLSMYGFLYPVDGFEILCLQAKDKMADFWKKAADDFTDEFVFCRVYDDTGQQVAGEPRNFRGRELLVGTVFHTLDLKNRFDGWKVELYLRLGVFHDVAQRQRMIYIWVAILVIVLMLGSTVLASKAVLRQVRINRLKNDFIATVTHELKTPLSSMRVLVDTLLEGNYNDQKQATEYLQLISKENTRLSRLIDHFLTFSRMERNKQAFDMTKTAPAEIAEAAAQAVHARFNGGDCNFTLTVDDQLPSVMADKDAMVTVLVNLLDNAYKYSYDHKQIELRVFRQNDFVAFAVKDNGIGMSRRQMRKVFDHFYQADRSLARRVEGAGLGLSIVKFIVNAHKGQIDVESKPGKGSKFVVKIPVCNKANSLMSRFVK